MVEYPSGQTSCVLVEGRQLLDPVAAMAWPDRPITALPVLDDSDESGADYVDSLCTVLGIGFDDL